MMHDMAHETDTSPVNGAAIKQLRETAGISQQRLATDAGIGMSTLNRAERSDPGLSYRNVVKIANALNVDVSAIYRDAPLQHVVTQTTSVTPEWAKQQNEQVNAALEDLRTIMLRMEATQRELAGTIGRMVRQ